MIQGANTDQTVRHDADKSRPPIAQIGAGTELRQWYWLKEELAAEARRIGVKSTGAKFTILDRLAHFLDTGETTWPGDKKNKTTSTFDWHSANLKLETRITDNYKNSQNVRRFFCQNADPKFKFSIALMAWIKANVGKTLADAVDEYHAQRAQTSRPGHQTDIQPHNQFNQYTRDYLKQNPDAGMEDVRRNWALKRAMPTKTGLHKYEHSDPELENGKQNG